MIEECTKDNYKMNCGNCVHGTTNGFYAPNVWCDQYPNKGKDESIQPYCYCNENYMGTTCEKFVPKNFIL